MITEFDKVISKLCGKSRKIYFLLDDRDFSYHNLRVSVLSLVSKNPRFPISSLSSSDVIYIQPESYQYHTSIDLLRIRETII